MRLQALALGTLLIAGSAVGATAEAQSPLTEWDARLAASVDGQPLDIQDLRSEILEAAPNSPRESALEVRQTLAVSLTQVLRISPAARPLPYWNSTRAILDTLDALKRQEELAELQSDPALVTEAVWRKLVLQTPAAYENADLRALNPATGETLHGQWIKRRKDGGVSIIELYRTDSERRLDWSMANVTKAVSNPLHFAHPPLLAGRGPDAGARLVAYIDISPLNDAAREDLLDALDEVERATFTSAVVSRAASLAKCTQPKDIPGAIEAVKGWFPWLGQAEPTGAAPFDAAEGAANGVEAQTQAEIQASCLTAAGPEVFAGKVLVFDPARYLQVAFISVEEAAQDWRNWLERFAYMADRWPS